jgi:eukaryotic-like serine/threonine-protein kinase
MPSLGSIGNYELLERIGSGAESAIYRAKDQRDNRIVAIKDIIARDAESRKYLGHVTNEFNILQTLHAVEKNGVDGIIRAYELLKSGFLRREKRCSLVMEFAVGKDLKRERRYPVLQMFDIFVQTATSLRFIHSLGYVHGDLKPENIMVDPHGKSKIVDFGFSCRTGTQLESVRGTRDYMAPEQVNRGLITERTDIYNFGATMYFLLSGKHVPPLIAPAGGDSNYIVSEDVKLTPLRELNPLVPEQVERLIGRCCQKEPLKRPANMDEIVGELTEINRKLLAD